MKRHLNTSYRLVWNHITGTLVVASELARSRGKGAGVAVALSLAAVTSVPALAADTVVQAGETVNGGTLTNHDNQIVLGTANGMTISTGLEYGPDNEANTGGQWIQNGGIANNTTVTGGGLQRVNAGGSVSDTVISAGGGQSLQGQAVNTTLNGGEQWVHEGGIATGTVINEKGWQAVKSGAMATDTVVNTGAEGGPDAENGDTGQTVYGDAVRTTINKNGRQIVAAEGTANTTVVYAGGDQTVHGHALDTTLNGGYPTMKIITRGEAMRIHRQHPASRLFPFCTGKYRWHGSAEAYTGREVQDIPGVLAVFAERRKDSFGPYVRLMSVTLN